MSRLLNAQFLTWVALHRVRRGGMARVGDQFCYRGHPMPPGLLAELLEYFLEEGLLGLGEPQESGLRRVSLTTQPAGPSTSGWVVTSTYRAVRAQRTRVRPDPGRPPVECYGSWWPAGSSGIGPRVSELVGSLA